MSFLRMIGAGLGGAVLAMLVIIAVAFLLAILALGFAPDAHAVRGGGA